MRPSRMDEFELIDRYFSPCQGDGEGVVVGTGDDGAVLALSPGMLLVAVVDTLVEGVHYPRDFAAADTGYRAVAVNLSDIAAMGATPAWMTLALTLPAADEAWLADFSAGLYEAAAEHGVVLVGGDTTRGRETVISVQLMGQVERGRVLTRGGCRPGDLIYVSGTLGDAAAALDMQGRRRVDPLLAERLRRPAARVALGRAAAGIASAAIDISDGLAADLGHVLSASGCGATVELERLPLSAALAAACSTEQARRFALTGGDDYELCLAVPPAAERAFLGAALACETPVTAIGTAQARTGLQFTLDGSVVVPDVGGYRHFGGGEGGP